MALPGMFERYRAAFDEGFREVFRCRELPLYSMMQYHLGWMDENYRPTPGSGGKALRPVLCLFACDAVGGDWRKAIPAAAALELTHNFSLVHDDIQDNDKERRHRPTVWWLWGAPQAINVGNGMWALSGLALTEAVRLGLPAAKVLTAYELLHGACLRMIEGQYLDISFESRQDTGVADYLDMIGRKTGALLGCSLEMGALMGCDSPEVTASFGEFGRALGIVFQIRDDILGVWGNPESMGKASDNDIRRKKKSLPIVCGLERAEGAQRKRLQKIYGGGEPSDGDVAEVLDILNSLDVPNACQAMAGEYAQKALATLRNIDLSPAARADVTELVTFLLERQY
ncbi:MAG: polyprenyl synthetase family protein [Chloroflexi bacterium]|nr:polyprenyl synthetase family protein [Chloroflexota bacterium]